MGIIGATFFIVGTSIGAGFISGAELVRFFPCERFLLPILISSAAFCAMCVVFLSAGRRYGGYKGAVNAFFGRAAPAVIALICFSGFVPCAGMLAGLDALLPDLKPLASIIGLLIAWVIAKNGAKGISVMNFVLVPALLFFVFFYGRGSLEFYYPFRAGFYGIGGGILYAGMNAFLAAPVLMEAGKSMKRVVPPSILASAVIAACAVCILGKIYREGAGAIGAEMPFLYAMRGNRIFYAASALAIMTSLTASVYPLFSACNGIRAGRAAKNAAKAGMLFAAFALSRLGLGGIVRYFYPVLGAFGLFLSAFGIFHDYFFQKHHKEIHSCGEQAENASRAHDEVELENLPAVNDKISEPRFGNDVFAHNRTDPCHADVNFQHRDKGIKRGGNDEFL